VLKGFNCAGCYGESRLQRCGERSAAIYGERAVPGFLPELRPFFLENASYFATPLTLLYTRNIIRPDVGARVRGRSGTRMLGCWRLTIASRDRRYSRAIRCMDPE